MNERVSELTAYLTALSHAQGNGYKCNGEIAEVIRELRYETELITVDDKSGLYFSKIVALCGDSYDKDMRFVNAQIYNAYMSGISGDLYVRRCSGTTTSLKALAKTFNDVVYTDERGNLTTDNITGKVVFTERYVDLPTGTRPKCVIKIRQIDFTEFNRANIF